MGWSGQPAPRSGRARGEAAAVGTNPDRPTRRGWRVLRQLENAPDRGGDGRGTCNRLGICWLVRPKTHASQICEEFVDAAS